MFKIKLKHLKHRRNFHDLEVGKEFLDAATKHDL